MHNNPNTYVSKNTGGLFTNDKKGKGEFIETGIFIKKKGN